jgi:hypothetical protein
MSDSVRTRSQKKVYPWRPLPSRGPTARIQPVVRYDDQCGNGHNTFSITADIRDEHGDAGGGCCHALIVEAWPELAPLIKWHLCSSDGPMHYLANTLYHVEQHGPDKAWLEVRTEVAGVVATGMIYGERAKLEAAAAQDPTRCTVKVDKKTAKIRNLDYARSSACWPEATDEELTAPGLKERLEARLPALLAEFRAAVESLGFVW